MDTSALKKFAQSARKQLLAQVATRLDQVLDPASLERRERPKAVADLVKRMGPDASHRQAIIDAAAYTWFNRFIALRYLDVCGYSTMLSVSPAEGQTRPEILAEAMAGNMPEGAPKHILSLLDGSSPSPDPQGEAYRLLLVHACNSWHETLPFLFEKIDDYTELLMPLDLLSQDSVLAEMRAVMTAEACQDVEIIGWLYQFYISEKKDEVFAGLKKNVKITAENIPAATQLFTPHWIVRYLVENSLGRLWLLNHPESKLAEQMDYYIAPEEPETDFLKVTKPEEIKICDPACGSGHMLTYAFDLLYAIYAEQGYDPHEIPALILRHNLTGIEIDDRAGALAAFALAMKAAAKLGRRRFLRMDVQPNIVVLQNVDFTEAELQEVAGIVGPDLFTDDLKITLGQFGQAKNFGSLIVPKLSDPTAVMRAVEAKDFSGDLLHRDIQARIEAVLRMTEALSPNYHVVVANPPYAGSKGLNDRLWGWVKDNYPNAKSDLYAAFIWRGLELCSRKAFCAMVTMESWIFLSSFEKLRSHIYEQSTIQSMVHMPYLGKGGTSMGINFGTTAFILVNIYKPNLRGNFSCVRYYECDDQGVPFEFPPKNERLSTAAISDFKKIPGCPIAYWASDNAFKCFSKGQPFKSIASAKLGMRTGDNNKWLRRWYEVSVQTLKTNARDAQDAVDSLCSWFPYNKGGDFRKWYGNNEHVVFWKDNGHEIKKETLEKYPQLSWDNLGWKITNEPDFFKPSSTWTFISSSSFGVRMSKGGAIFDVAGSSAFPDLEDLQAVVGFMCSKVAFHFLLMSNPTLNFQVANINSLPWIEPNSRTALDQVVADLVEASRSDWDAYETSWDFTTLPLLSPDYRPDPENATLADSYATLRAHWQSQTSEMQRLEEENNRIFIDAYGLQDELTPDVPIEEITLTCNPAYRYGGKHTEAELEDKLRADTMVEFLSYAVGCMFGRYSLDAPGLILANQGETLEDYLKKVPSPAFMPDEDNVIPVLDGNWFPDDITERFRNFLRVTFGEAHFRENLTFIEDALGKDIRKYFTRDFYKDHVKRYKKRPIYWMFASPKGTFRALIYMHRYRPDTVAILLNDYLRPLMRKLDAERIRLEKLALDASASQGEKTRAVKEGPKIAAQIAELTDWERDVVFPLAQQKIAIDLDDGVKHNYPLFGSALQKIPGLEAKDE